MAAKKPTKKRTQTRKSAASGSKAAAQGKAARLTTILVVTFTLLSLVFLAEAYFYVLR